MTDSSKVLIGLLVDRSGSMNVCRTDMQGGIDTFIETQKKLKGQAKATLAQFDDRYDLVYGPTPIEDVPNYHLVPRGMTAMHDAMGKFITDIGTDLSKMKDVKRPGKIIICIVTDGLENASKEWTKHAVAKLIKQQQDDYKWEFVFLGANMDAVAEAKSFNIAASNAMTYDVTNSGLTMNNLARSVSAYAMASPGVAYSGFTDEDREDALKQ
jgi:uncharacterized protein YegL